MKKAIILTLLISSVLEISAQYRDTILWYNKRLKQPRWIMTCEDNTKQDCQLMSYFQNRKMQGKALVFYDRSTIRPNGDAIIYAENGAIKQEYNHKTGTLLSYYDSGELREKMITAINDTVEYKYKFFKNGTLWEEEVARHEVGRQSLAYSWNRREGDMIYDNQGITYNYLKTFHGNGNLKSFSFINTDSKRFEYKHQFYSPDGQLDTNAKKDNRHKDFGRRYYYHPNGQLREIADFENGKWNGELIRWTASGQMVWKSKIRGQSRYGEFQSWWENGQLKETGQYVGGYKNGGFLAFNRQGEVMEYGTYLAGDVVGVATRWDTLGNLFGESFGSKEKRVDNWYYDKRHIREETVWLERKGDFDANGLRHGQWIFTYYRKGKERERIGKTCAVANYKNGYLHGETTVYYENGNTLLIANYEDGLLHGDYISYWETGDMCVKGQFEQHVKQGIWESTHYQSNKKSRVVRYIDNQSETLQEWDVDSFMKKNTIDNKAENQIEKYDYYKSGMFQKYVTPYGREHADTYRFDTAGFLKETRILIFDNPQNYTWTKYYQNGNKASAGTYVNSKTEGIYWTWYENGQLKTQSFYSVGKQDGEAVFWNENGTIKEKRYYKNGIQIINDEGETALIPCICNRPPDEVINGFMNWLPSYVELEKVNNRTPFFNITEQHYKRLFCRNIQMYDNHIYGKLVVTGDVAFRTNNDLTLNLTACRRGGNRTYLNINGDYNERTKQVELTISDFDLKIESPYNLLHPYDFENQQPQNISIEKFRSSGVTFKVKDLIYQDNIEQSNNAILPHIAMIQEKNTTSCFPDSEIGNTGIVMVAENGIADLSVFRSIEISLAYSKINAANNYLTIDKAENYYIPNRNYLNEFMGVYFENATFFFTEYDLNLKGKGKHIFVGGNEMIGNFEIVTSNNFSAEKAAIFYKYLDEIGFEIINHQMEDEEILRVFWKYEIAD